MMRKLLVAIAIVLSTLVALRFLTRGKITTTPSVAAIRQAKGFPVRVAHPLEVPLEDFVLLEGSLKPFLEVECSSEIDGRIIEMAVDVGHHVRRGEVIVRIEPATYAQRCRRAQASLEAAEARLKKLETGARPEEREQARARVAEADVSLAVAKREENRARELVASRALPTKELDGWLAKHEMAKARLRVARSNLALILTGAREEDLLAARANVEAARASLELDKISLGHTKVPSPIDGVISKKRFEVGEYVINMPSPQVLYEIVDIERVYLEAEVSELDVARLVEGQEVEVSVDALSLLSSNPVDKTKLMGTISEISPVGDASRRSFGVKVLIDNKDHELKPGMFARGKVIVRRLPSCLALETTWFGSREGGFGDVFVIHEGRARKRRLTLGIEQGSLVQVVAGLNVTDMVVTEGLRMLEDGERLRILNPPKTGGSR